MDLKLIVKEIDKILYLTGNTITKTRKESISMLAHCGEEALAFEILCSNLYEYESLISQQVYDSIEDVGISLNLDRKEWGILKYQITSKKI